MVSDSEPRYRLVDSQGNTVGTLYAKSGGTLALQEGSSGSDNEIELQTDGTLQTDSINTDGLSLTPINDFTFTFSSGEVLGFRSKLSDLNLGDPIIVSAVPNNDPGNSHAYAVNNIKWDDSNNALQVTISETLGNGGGEARITSWRLGV